MGGFLGEPCFWSFVIALAVGVWLTYLIVESNQVAPPRPSLKQIMKQFRKSTSVFERVFLGWTIFWTFGRLSKLGVLAALYAFLGTGVMAVCNWDWVAGMLQVMRELPQFVRDMKDALFDNPPPAK